MVEKKSSEDKDKRPVDNNDLKLDSQLLTQSHQKLAELKQSMNKITKNVDESKKALNNHARHAVELKEMIET